MSHLLPWPPKGGVQQRAYYLARALAERHRLAFVCRYQAVHQTTPQAVDSAVDAMKEFCEAVIVEPLPIRNGPLISAKLIATAHLTGVPASVLWAASRTFGTTLQEFCSSYRPDIVHVDTISLSQYRRRLSQACLVLNHHNIESDMLARRASHMNPALRWTAHFEARRLRHYEREEALPYRLHLVCSELDRQRLLEVTGHVETRVVPNGTDTAYFRPGGPAARTTDPDIIFVGGMAWYPNASAIKHFLTSVWPLVCSRAPRTTFTVIGRSPPKWLIEYSRHDTRVRPLGFVDDIRPFVENAALFICPIFDGGGTKLKMLDAMSMAKAIVAHPVSCEGLGVQHGVHLCIAESPRDFANSIIELLDSAARRAAMGGAARSHVERNFSFSSIGATLAETYAAL